MNKPADHTFNYFLDETIMDKWISGFRGIEILRGNPREVESLYKMMILYNGKEVEVFQKIENMTPHEHLLLRMEHPELITYSDITFIDNGPVTEMSCKVKVVCKKLHLKLAMPLVKSVLETRNNKDYTNFKKVVEKRK